MASRLFAYNRTQPHIDVGPATEEQVAASGFIARHDGGLGFIENAHYVVEQAPPTTASIEATVLYAIKHGYPASATVGAIASKHKQLDIEQLKSEVSLAFGRNKNLLTPQQLKATFDDF